MATRFQDWFTNILGVQSVAQFGAQQSVQHDAGALASMDCAAYINTFPKGFERVSLSVIKNNLAVVPEWTAAGTGHPWLQAESLSTELVGCSNQIKATSFISFNDDFLEFIGTSATASHAQTFIGVNAEHVHEAPVYVPQLDELIYADTFVTGWLWALNTKTGETRKILTQPPLPNVNGGTLKDGKLYLTTNGGNAPAIHSCTLPTKSKVGETITCTTIVNNYRLAHFNSPNDLIFTSAGNILFTDPTYGWTQSWEGVGPPELPTAVYHFNIKTGAVTVLTTDILQPNGLALSPDEKTVYVADSNSTSSRPVRVWEDSVRNVYAFDFDEAKLKLSAQRLLHVVERGWPDGLRLTTSKKGKQLLLVASMGGADVVDVTKGGAGTLLGKFNVGDDIIFNLEPINKDKSEWLLTGKKAVYRFSIAG